MDCYTWYSHKEPAWGELRPRQVPSSLYHSSMASVPTSYYSMRHCSYLAQRVNIGLVVRSVSLAVGLFVVLKRAAGRYRLCFDRSSVSVAPARSPSTFPSSVSPSICYVFDKRWSILLCSLSSVEIPLLTSAVWPFTASIQSRRVK